MKTSESLRPLRAFRQRVVQSGTESGTQKLVDFNRTVQKYSYNPNNLIHDLNSDKNKTLRKP